MKVFLGAESCGIGGGGGGIGGVGGGGGGDGGGGGGGDGFFEPASQCKLQAAGMVEHLQE